MQRRQLLSMMAAAGLTATLSSAAWAQAKSKKLPALKLDTPFQPDSEMETVVNILPLWIELYAVPPAELSKALTTLKAGGVPTALGVVLGEELVVQRQGRLLKLSGELPAYRRASQAVSYDDPCKEHPQLGDTLEQTFLAPSLMGGASATLTGRVIERQFVGKPHPLSEDDAILPALNEVNCQALSQFRVFYQGELRLAVSGYAPLRQSVLFQVISD